MQNFDNRLLKILEEEAAKEKSKKKLNLYLIKEKKLQYYSGWNKKKWVKHMDEEIGRIKKSDTTEIVIKVDEFRGEKGVNIREYITTDRYTGFTKQGTRIPVDKWKEFKELINKVNL